MRRALMIRNGPGPGPSIWWVVALVPVAVAAQLLGWWLVAAFAVLAVVVVLRVRRRMAR